MTPSAFESALRQKEGELASYMSRLVRVFFFLNFSCLKDHLLSHIFSLYAVLCILELSFAECTPWGCVAFGWSSEFMITISMCSSDELFTFLICFRHPWNLSVTLSQKSWSKWQHRWVCTCSLVSQIYSKGNSFILLFSIIFPFNWVQWIFWSTAVWEITGRVCPFAWCTGRTRCTEEKALCCPGVNGWTWWGSTYVYLVWKFLWLQTILSALMFSWNKLSGLLLMFSRSYCIIEMR
jgi:hypothetical protein